MSEALKEAVEEMARELVQVRKGSSIEAKKYVLFHDAKDALQKAYEMGVEAALSRSAGPTQQFEQLLHEARMLWDAQKESIQGELDDAWIADFAASYAHTKLNSRSAPDREALVEGEPCPTCGKTVMPKMGTGDYSCAVCGFGMQEPCEHWKKMLAESPSESAQTPAPEGGDEPNRSEKKRCGHHIRYSQCILAEGHTGDHAEFPEDRAKLPAPEGMGRFTVVHDGPSRPMLSLGNRIFRVEEFINGRWQCFDDDEAICAALAHPTSGSGTDNSVTPADDLTADGNWCPDCEEPRELCLCTNFNFNWDARAKKVYWRTCSTCGDIDRSELAKAMKYAAEEYVKYLDRRKSESGRVEEQDDSDAIPGHYAGDYGYCTCGEDCGTGTQFREHIKRVKASHSQPSVKEKL